MATFDSDDFTGTTGTLLSAHTPQAGGSWTISTSNAATMQLTAAGRVRPTTAGAEPSYVCNGTPASADYDVQADLFLASTTGYGFISARGDAGFANVYEAGYDTSTVNTGTVGWALIKGIANSFTALGHSAATPGAGSTSTMLFSLRGTTLTMKVGGTTVITATDSGLSTAGKAGVDILAGGTATDSVGVQLDNFSAADPVTATFPPVPGVWHNPLIPQ